MWYVIKNSVEHIGSLLNQALLVLFLFSVVYCALQKRWRKNSLYINLGIITFFLVAWRFVLPLASSRYYAILILPAIFFSAFLWEKAGYRKWTCSWLIIISAVVMLGKDFRYTSNNYRYLEAAAVVREDLPSGPGSVFATLANDYNKYRYVLNDRNIELMDLSLRGPDIQKAMLYLQLPLNYDRIYVAEKLETPTSPFGNAYSTLCRYPIGKRKCEDIFISRRTGERSKILPRIRTLLTRREHVIMNPSLPMPEKQQEPIRQHLVSQGFSKFKDKRFALPFGWVPEIYEESVGKKTAWVTATSGEVLIQVPQSLALVCSRRLTLNEDYYFVADVTAVSPVELRFGTHGYYTTNGGFAGSTIHGIMPLKPEEQRLVIFRLNAAEVNGRSVNLRCIVSGGSIRIRRLYFFPCRLAEKPEENKIAKSAMK